MADSEINELTKLAWMVAYNQVSEYRHQARTKVAAK
jgi:hypothetical protein